MTFWDSIHLYFLLDKILIILGSFSILKKS